MSKPSAAAFAAASRQFLGRTYQEMDCQAFVEAAMALVGIHENLAGSNAWYRKMTWTGTPEECKATFGCIPVGALLFIHDFDGGEPAKYCGDGKGNASHIGIKTGTGLGAIHSSSSRGGVFESEFHDKTIKNGGWNTVGLWDAFDYDGASLTPGQSTSDIPTPEPEPAPSPAHPAEPTTPTRSTATVTAEKGSSVKMRSKPSKSSNLYWDVPIGSIVTVLGIDTGGWTHIAWNGRSGYMMSEYLTAIPEEGTQTEPQPDASFPDEEQPTEPENNYAAEIYDLTSAQAEEIKSRYPSAVIFQTNG